MSVEIDVTKNHVPKNALRLVADCLVRKASTEQIKKLEENLRQTGWGKLYQSSNLLMPWLIWERPTILIQAIVPIMLSKSYKSEGCDFPSAEIFADITYVILELPRPEKKLKQISLVKEIVDYIQSNPLDLLRPNISR